MRQYLLAEISDNRHNFLKQMLPLEAECILRYNVASTARLVVKNNHPVLPLITDPSIEGARATLWLIRFGQSTVLKHKLLEGEIGDVEGAGPYGDVTIPVIDDWAWLDEILAQPNPALPITEQDREFARYSGPSDTRALNAIRQNAERLNLPWVVAASEGLGRTGVTDLREQPLSAVAPDLTLDRLRLHMRRDAGHSWSISVDRGDVYPRPLTPESGILTSWQWKRERRKYTRMVVGGSSTGLDRKFASVVDATAEASVGRIKEGFVSATGADTPGDLATFGRDALAAAGQKASLVATLRESSWFRFPDAYNIGTQVTVQPGAGVSVEDIITEVRIVQSRDGALVTTPRVGIADMDPSARLTKIIGSLASAVRGLERR
ncbi:hypothetical protein AB0P19_02345 [Microbacterium oleivorans]|uniref:Gp37-like protein n=1 Tax=Microbacterium oleivorans TaxID=273677 RepID=UPI003431AA1C